ncbi:MAG TPA: hypothetical protein VMH36_06015 [Alphaproteobacteria bacterium]|nr:hypothetical protein [Alphaproteobacteria bacterium]
MTMDGRRPHVYTVGSVLGLCCRAAASASVLLALAAGPVAADSGASNTATLAKARDIRAKLAAAGFSDIVNLQEREGGTWSCRALRFDTAVRLEIDRDGKISIM